VQHETNGGTPLALRLQSTTNRDDRGAYVVCEKPRGRTIVSCKWVHKLKHNIVTDKKGNVTSNKARLVAAGFPQKPGTDYEEM
jgi:hypothetical protein